MNSKPSPEALQAIKRRTDELLVKWIEDYEEVRTGGVVDELGAGGKAFRDMMKEGADVGRDQALEMIEELDFKPIHKVVKEDVLEHPSVSQAMDTETLESPITLDKASYEFAKRMIEFGKVMSNPEMPRAMRLTSTKPTTSIDSQLTDNLQALIEKAVRPKLSEAEEARQARLKTSLEDCIEQFTQYKLRLGESGGKGLGWKVEGGNYKTSTARLKLLQVTLQVLASNPALPMDEITQDHTATFKRLMRNQYPRRLPKVTTGVVKGWLKSEEKGIKQSEENRPSAATFGYFTMLYNGFFKWAVDEGYLIVSPWGKEPIEVGTRKSKPRAEWSPATLKAFYGHISGKEPLPPKVYPSEISAKITDTSVSFSYWWVWSIALYSGMRLKEAAQLYCDDILEVSDRSSDSPVLCFRVTANETRGQQIKNKGSNRLIPIHKELLEAGFMEKVKAIKTADEPLFPALWSVDKQKKPRLKTNMSDFISKHITTHLRRLESQHEDYLYDFHSLRHTVNGHLKRLEVPDRVIKSITGHSASSDMTEHYGDGLRPSQLKPYLDKVNYGFNLKDYL